MIDVVEPPHLLGRRIVDGSPSPRMDFFFPIVLFQSLSALGRGLGNFPTSKLLELYL
jgi:hypothetical protein